METNFESSFISYHLTSKEMEVACSFNTLQFALLQNLIAEAAEEKIAIKFDPLNPQAFIQQEAELAGKISILKYLISLRQSLPSSET